MKTDELKALISEEIDRQLKEQHLSPEGQKLNSILKRLEGIEQEIKELDEEQVSQLNIGTLRHAAQNIVEATEDLHRKSRQ